MRSVAILYLSLLLFFSSSAQVAVTEAPWFSGRQEAHATAVDDFGRIWIGTANEVFVDDGRSCKPLNIMPENKIQFQFGGAYITGLFNDGLGSMWITTGGGGLFQVNQISGAVDHWRYDPDFPEGIQSDFLWDLEFRDNLVFIGSDVASLQVLDRSTGKFTQYQWPDSFPKSPKLPVRGIQVDRYDSSKWWLATGSGLMNFFPDQGQFIHHRTPDFLFNSQYDNNGASLLAIDQDSTGALWIGSWYFGLVRYDPDTRLWKNFRSNPDAKDYPHSQNIVFDLITTGKYVCTAEYSYGANLFDIERQEYVQVGQIRHEYDYERRCLSVSAYKNKFMIPQPSGCMEVSVGKEIPADLEKPYISNLRIFGENRDDKFDLFHPTELEVEFGDSVEITIGVTGLLPGNADVDFRFGSADNWQTIRPFEEKKLAFDDYAKHDLQLRYRWNTGRWLESNDQLTVFSIRSIWTYWYTYASGVFLILLIIQTIRRRLKKARIERDAMEERYQRKLAETQMAALRSQMNPHFLFNSLNSIKDFIVTNNPEDAVNHLQKFSELIRAILENSKEREISLTKELETVKLYADLEALRCGGKFRLNIEIVPDINPDLVTVPPMIIQPYVENAIWHGLLPKEGKGLIQIRCSIVDSMLTIVIEDNGIGRIEAQKRKESSVVKRKSVGMSITRERIKLSDTDQSSSGLKVEDLKDDQGQPAGTRITIYWKYQIDQTQYEAAQGNNNR